MTPEVLEGMREDNRYGTLGQVLPTPPEGGSVVYAYARDDKQGRRPAGVGSDNDYVQGLLKAYTTVFFPGRYNVGNLELENGQRLIGVYEGGNKAILRGTTPIARNWSAVSGGKLWRLPYTGANASLPDADVPDGPTRSTRCADNGDACLRKRNLFIDARMAYHAKSKAAVGTNSTSAREWYFDDANDVLYLERERDDTEASIRDLSYSLSTEDRAFSNAGGLAAFARDVYVANLAFFGYAEQAFTTGHSWKVERCEFIYNHREGVELRGDSNFLVRNHFYNNSNIGIKGTTNDSRVVYNRINNTNFFGLFRQSWQAAGLKVTQNAGLEVAHNYVHDNNCNALWTDVYAVSTSYHRNLVERNPRGIHYEISRGGNIYQNVINDSGDFDVLITGAHDTRVHSNTVFGARNGITLKQSRRDFYPVNSINPSRDACVGVIAGKDLRPDCNEQIRDITVDSNKVTVTREADKPVGILVELPCNGENGFVYPTDDYLGRRFYTNPDYGLVFDRNYYVVPDQERGSGPPLPYNKTVRHFASWGDSSRLCPGKPGSRNGTFGVWRSKIGRDANSCVGRYVPDGQALQPRDLGAAAGLDAITVAPVPLADELTLRAPDAVLADVRSVSLVAVDGRTYVVSDGATGAAGPEWPLALPDLPAGVYALQIHAATSVRTVPVFKQ